MKENYMRQNHVIKADLKWVLHLAQKVDLLHFLLLGIANVIYSLSEIMGLQSSYEACAYQTESQCRLWCLISVPELCPETVTLFTGNINIITPA